MNDADSSERGMTLVEVLLSMLLLGFVTLGSVALLIAVLSQNKLARHRSLATNLANERIEQVSSMRFQPAGNFQVYGLPSETAGSGSNRTLTADYGTIPDFPEFRRVLTLNYEVPSPGMLQVVADVSWLDLRQGTKSHTMITYIHPALEGR